VKVHYLEIVTKDAEMTRYWSEGDTVPVLYDRDDPQHSCFVYR
jgi:hypothetical protein